MPQPASAERIAIVGIGGIFPGAPDLDTFWRNIAGGVDSGRHVPEGRWYLSPEKAYAPWPPQPDRVYSTWGCFIEGFQLDPTGLNIDHDLLARLDPMFHLGLHAARQAFRDAKQLGGVDHSRVGVILGNIALPTESTSAICRDVLGRTFVEKLIDAAASAEREEDESKRVMSDEERRQWAIRLKASLGRAAPPTNMLAPASQTQNHSSSTPYSALRTPHSWHPLNRYAAGLPSSLIAQGLGLGGMAFTLDAACASSLYALKFASEELLAHRADAMLAGGMSRPDCQYTQMGFAQLQALSKSGRCAPLSGEADGLVVGEGAGVFVLKRLSDAVAAGDHIYGVIAGIGLSNDRGANLLAPHSEGQLRAMRSAYEQAGWKPSDVDLIECHATGTPVGDAVEIESLHQLWQHESAKPRQCVIGGVKSNVGHLLTGAGAAGLMKVLFALKHQTLPPTANYSRPAERLAASDSPFQVLSESQSWRLRSDGSPRRATINAFGFGGINAHVLIEEWQESRAESRESRARRDDTTTSCPTLDSGVAIVGLDSHVGTWNSKQSVQENDFQGKPLEWTELNWWGVEQSDWFRREGHSDDTGWMPTQSAKPTGHGITEVRMPMGQFRIPPLEMQDMLPQQQLMLKVAAGAIRDAQRGRVPTEDSVAQASADGVRLRTGVFIGIELDPNTTNFHLRWSVEQDAPRWAEMLGLDVTPDELAEWTKQLKEAVGPPLTPNRVMGNLGGIVASRLAREFDVGGPSFTISCGGGSDLVATELAVRALQRGELDQAIVGGVDLSSDPRCNIFDRPPQAKHDDGRSDEERNQRNRLEFHSAADMTEAIILKRLDDAIRIGDRCYGQIRDYQGAPGPLRADPPGLRNFRPHGASFISGNLTIHLLRIYQGLNRENRYSENPAESDWARGRVAPFIWRHAKELRKLSLFTRHNRERRLQLIFEEVEAQVSSIVEVERRRPIGEFPIALFVIDGDSIAELLTTLDELVQAVAGSFHSAEKMAIRWFRSRPRKPERQLTITLVANGADELRQAINTARDTLRGNGSPNSQLTRQVFFSSKPLARHGRVAFVFPGSGNIFCRMGRTLLSVFPEVLRRQENENADLAAQYRPDLIWPHRLKLLELEHKSMIFSQVAMGTAICDLLALFGVRPSASIGYSLGESAALFGLRAWTDRDEMLRRMEESPLFGSDLVAPFDAVRKAWSVPDGEPVDWVSGVIDRSADEVRAAMAQVGWDQRQRFATPAHHDVGASGDGGPALEASLSHPTGHSRARVYLLIVNTPTQCVIGGERSAVERLVGDLSATFVPFAAPSTVHCEVLRAVEAKYRELHLMRTTPPVGIDFYSTAWGDKYDLSRESAAEAIVAQAVDTIDFPRVIERAYADGVRIFVEIGPGSSCTKLIDEILGDRPHLARAALPNTSRPVETFLELLAALIAERVPVDLSYLYGKSSAESRVSRASEDDTKSPAREIVTRVGGLPFEIPAPPGGWRFREVAEVTGPLHQAEHPDEVLSTQSSERTARDAGRSEMTSLLTAHSSALGTQHSPLVSHHSASLLDQLLLMTDFRTQAHDIFLRFSEKAERLAAQHLAVLAQAGATASTAVDELDAPKATTPFLVPWPQSSRERGAGTGEESFLCAPPAVGPRALPPRSLNRDECMTFAIGRIGDVLGTMFAEIDQHPTRVRLPDEPLMLVDRILSIEGEPLSMTSGRVVTEHDIHPGAWYLDCGRIPTCIAVESGQADLFLSGWLGIDLQTKGLACYRLLDAVVTFHDELPQPGRTIHYDIRLLHFFRQGDTYLFRFEFDATVDGKPLLTMREGCAGFFTEAELAGGKGIIHTALDKRPRPGKRPADWSDPVPMAVESYDDSQLLALRRGDLATCFGPAFASLPLREPVTIPGLLEGRVAMTEGEGTEKERLFSSSGSSSVLSTPYSASHSPFVAPQPSSLNRSRMWLIDRVLKLDPVGGKFGMGTILGELDIHPDDWFLTCHFCDDQVMPGTLMYECCMHTLRIFLLRMGWVGEAGQVAYQPIPEVRSRLKCRGQVLSSTKKVWYEVTLKEVGYSPDAYCLADALMYVDGKPIVEITDMSVRLTGLSREKVEQLWSGKKKSEVRSQKSEGTELASSILSSVFCLVDSLTYDHRPAIFNTDRITAFAIGKPSEAFGDKYRVFDDERKIARLPGPPFQFLDRIVSIENCQPWKLEAGGEIVAQYDIPFDAWYFVANRQPTMPFAVLLETALQPCGWLAAYLGSALTSETDLSFRNLGGKAIQYREVAPQSGTLTTRVKITKVSQSGGMIIQNFDYHLSCNGEPVYVGDTYFGFFSKASLANQVGIRDAKVFVPSAEESARASRFNVPDAAPFANSDYMMIDNAELLLDGGPHGLGYVRGTMQVDPSAWFFKAHFYQDPVVPGSLGLESFFQLMKFYAAARWGLGQNAQFQTPSLRIDTKTSKPVPHEWVYRGQVVPHDNLVTVTAVVTEIDDAARQLTAEGFLSVDGRVIYQMKQFTTAAR